MNTPTAVNEYFAAWNRRDPAAIVNTFVDGGTYADPISGEITCQAIADYAAGLFAAFPDLSFEATSMGSMDGGAWAARWIMRGTNTGSLPGMPYMAALTPDSMGCLGHTKGGG
jgi:predicted ester cyclase